MKRFALAGNPNSGKTTLFNNLTGSTAHVGNWPGVTVEKKEGVYKRKKSEGVEIIDLPGIYSLSPYTPEEVISRNYILDEKPDCVINIVDATNLERNLYLTTQLLEMDVPVVVALNMIDVVNKKGDVIDVNTLSSKLGVPVVAISALKQKHTEDLMEVAIQASEKGREGSSVLESSRIGDLVKNVKEDYIKNEVTHPLFHAIKLIEKDELEKGSKEANALIESYKESFNDDTFGDDFEAVVADERYKYIAKNFAPALKRKEPLSKDVKKRLTVSDKIDKVLTNRWLGIPIFLVILFLIFHFTFSENFLYLSYSGVLDGVNVFNFSEDTIQSAFNGAIVSDGALMSPGYIITNLFVGCLDSIAALIAQGLESIAAPMWVQSFINDGLIGGLFAIFGFLPQILILFLFFSILEDSGYMARVAFILDRIFRRLGLSGRAIIPMIMGFGCSIPAMVNTRTLADDNERTATIRVIPFFSCGAKLPILAGMAGALAHTVGMSNPDLITYGMYLLGMVTALVCVILMRNTTMRGKTPPFIMELPAYHWPQFKALMVHLWDKTKHFVKKAFTIILLSTILIWFLQSFTPDYRMISEDSSLGVNDSILAQLGMIIQPLFTPLGFGSQLTTYGWVFAVAAITGLIAKENVISTFGALASLFTTIDPSIIESLGEEVGPAYAMIVGTGISNAGVISFIAFNMLTIPCFAAVASAKGELKKGTFKWTLLFWLVVSYVVGTMIYLVGEWWWTVFIFVAVLAVAIVLIVYINKRLDQKNNDKIKMS